MRTKTFWTREISEGNGITNCFGNAVLGCNILSLVYTKL